MNSAFVTGVSVRVPGADSADTLPELLLRGDRVRPYRTLSLGPLTCRFTRPDLLEESPHEPSGKDVKIMRHDVVLGVECVGRLLEGLTLTEDERRNAGLYVATGLCQDEAIEEQIQAMCDEFLVEHTGATEAERNLAFFRLLPPLIAVLGLPNAGACFIAREFGIRGPNAVFGVTSHAGHTALREGRAAVIDGRATCAVVGGANASGSLSALALSPLRSTGGTVVEACGAAFLLLESASSLERTGRNPLCQLTSVRSFAQGPEVSAELDPGPWLQDLARPPDVVIVGGTVFEDADAHLLSLLRGHIEDSHSWFPAMGSPGAASVSLDLCAAATLIAGGKASLVVGLNRDVYGRISRFVAEAA